MSNKKKTDIYYITATVTLDTDIEISANSLEEALEKAKELDIHSFVDILGSHNDSSLEIKGLYKV